MTDIQHTTCPHCTAKIPYWWVRDYCASCGEELQQTIHQKEIMRLTKVIEDIDDITSFDWSSMPESIKENIHKQIRNIVLTALVRKPWDNPAGADSTENKNNT